MPGRIHPRIQAPAIRPTFEIMREEYIYNFKCSKSAAGARRMLM